MIKIKNILFEQTLESYLQDMGDTEDALNRIRPLFNDGQWNNFQSMWGNIDKDTWYRQGPLQRIGIGKKINKPLTIKVSESIWIEYKFLFFVVFIQAKEAQP